MVQAARFAATSVVGLAGTMLVGVLLALVLGLVIDQWQPLQTLDVAVVQSANDVVRRSAVAVTVLAFVTDLGGTEAATLLLTVTTVWLWIRRLPRLAAFVAVTGLGAAVLSPGLKAAIDRLRPVVEAPVVTPASPSFPSGHALGSTVTYGVLVLVFLPVVPPRWRPAFVGAAVALALTIGLTRIALGLHYPSDVVVGWLLGTLWLAATATAFRSWRRRQGLARRLSEGLEPEARPALDPAPAHDHALPAGCRSAARLLVAGVLVWGATTGLGFLVTEVAGPVRRLDVAAVRWFAEHRSPPVGDVMVALGHLGGSAAIVIVLLVAIALALAVLGRWRPALFLLLATAGESMLSLAVAWTVERAPPPVDGLTTMPTTSSFPSGHVAASVATYGAIALLTLAWSNRWYRWVPAVVAVLAPVAVALSRLYQAAHFPTDVLAAAVSALAWLLACWLVLRPAQVDVRRGPRRAPRPPRRRASSPG